MKKQSSDEKILDDDQDMCYCPGTYVLCYNRGQLILNADKRNAVRVSTTSSLR